MEQSRLHELEDQCIQDCPPPCVSLCPVHVDIRQLCTMVVQGDFVTASKVFRKSVPFPEIIARTCDQPCQVNCNRDTLGGAIRVAELERACVEFAEDNPSSVTVLPRKNAHIAIIGGGLSGLTAAYDLSRKGYHVSLFEAQSRLGGRLWNLSQEQLPPDTITRETSLISHTWVDIHMNERADAGMILSGKFDAVYLGIGGQNLKEFELKMDHNGIPQVDPVTFQTSRPNIFTGGSTLRKHSSTILSVSDGRRAAISIDRFVQNVSLAASRTNEGAYITRLVTNLSGVEARDVITPAQSGKEYSIIEAKSEAARCMQCECMECVKACEYLKHYGSYPKKYIRETYNNLSIIMRVRSGNKFTNSCTLCGLCGEVCPTDLNMGAVNLEVRETMVKTGKMPISAHDFALRDMAFSNGEKFALALPSKGSKTCSYLFFPGCQLAASNPDYIPQIYDSLTSVLPDLGVMLRCCGAPADWSGEVGLFNNSLKELKNQWQELGKPAFILACSSCNRVFKQFLPEANVTSIWEVFQEHDLFPKRRISGRQFVVHDPCTSRYENSWQNSVRDGLKAMGGTYHELMKSRNLTECCGYGGVAWLAHPELARNIVKRRIGEDDAAYLTYCVMCRDLFAAEGKPTLHLLDLMYAENLDALSTRKGPDYSQRHENRTRVRQKILNLLSGKDVLEVESHEKYKLNLSPQMRALLESRLILVEDIQKVIEHAETSGERFVNQESGHSLAYFKPNIITYWVEYSRSGEAYNVHDAYSHRMDFEEGAGK
jgi:glutamate synthase (NADPH/NADH) small chain